MPLPLNKDNDRKSKLAEALKQNLKKRKGIHSKNLSRGKHPANLQYKKPYNRQGR